MQQKLYKLLHEYYGNVNLHFEVEKVLKEARRSIDYNNPFKNLVITILSQNTSDANAARAYLSLERVIGELSPRKVFATRLEKIKRAIKVCGLYNSKARTIKNLAKYIVENYDSDLSRLIKMPAEQARSELLKIPGIGEKTADVFLGYVMGHDVAPIDTHIRRVSQRLGLVRSGAKYSEIQEALKHSFPRGKLLRGHELLIRLGRDFCKAKSPKCSECPVRSVCKFARESSIS